MVADDVTFLQIYFSMWHFYEPPHHLFAAGFTPKWDSTFTEPVFCFFSELGLSRTLHQEIS